jgi:hypothetical protein
MEEEKNTIIDDIKIKNLGILENGKSLEIPIDLLNKHVAIYGSTGSGKTVLGKAIIEECAINNIPSILIDTQGDLTSLAIAGDKKDLLDKNVPLSLKEEFDEKVEIRIFSPTSDQGIPISIDPFKIPKREMTEYELVRFLDVTASGIIGLLGYPLNSNEGKTAKIIIYELLMHHWKSGESIKNFKELGDILATSPGYISCLSDISSKQLNRITRDIRFLSIGLNDLFFHYGYPIDVNLFLEPIKSDKIPINIIYLNSLPSENYKQFFVAMIGREIYNWMSNHPSNTPQLVFYMDEMSSFLPPDPYSPPAKHILRLLLKTGRKYGISCIMNTQNIADVDYKSLGQAAMIFIGKLMAVQDIDKIKHLIKQDPILYKEIVKKIPLLSVGKFITISPDILQKPLEMNVRWLLTEHRVVEEDEIKDLNKDYIKEYFNTDFSRDDITDVQKDIELSTTSEKDLPQIKSDEIFVFELKYPQNLAIRRIKKICSSHLFQRVKVKKVDFNYLPLWHALCKIGPENSMLLKVEKTFIDLGINRLLPLGLSGSIDKSIFVNAVNNRILIVKRDFMTFSNIVADNLIYLKGLGKNNGYSPHKLKDIQKDMLKPVIKEEECSTLIFRTFGIKPKVLTLVLLPFWNFEVKIESYTLKKSLDGVMGLEII